MAETKSFLRKSAPLTIALGPHVASLAARAAAAAGLALLLLLALLSPGERERAPLLFQPLQEVRWGIVGCGDVTEKKSGPALSLIQHSRLVMVMRRNASLAKDYARRHKVPRWTSDALALINDPEVNAVYIATPPRYHVQYALLAAQAGKPAYVEKPMGLSFADGVSAVKEFQSRGIPLFVAYYRRALPNFLHIKSLLESGAIGRVLAVQVVYHKAANKHDFQWQKASRDTSKDPSQPDVALPGASLRDPLLRWRTDPAVGGLGGYFRDKGSHQLDLLQFWLGPIEPVSGFASNQQQYYPSSDSVTASFMFKSGVIGSGSWCFVVGKNAEQEFGEITGTRGRIRFQFFLSNKVELVNETGTFQFDIPNPKHVQQPLLQTVVDALRGEGECPSTGETAIQTSLLMDAIVGAKTPTFWALGES